MGYFEKIINKEEFEIETDSQLSNLLSEMWVIERIVGFKMHFTTEFYNYHAKFMGGMRVHIVKLEDVSKEMRDEIIYFWNLKKEKELKKEQELKKEAISVLNDLKSNYDNFMLMFETILVDNINLMKQISENFIKIGLIQKKKMD